MIQSTTLTNITIFSGYSQIGSCQEFVWIAGSTGADAAQNPSRFIIRGLKCNYDVEALMIRKDLYLRSESGKEYVVSNFQITDIEDVENISGIAENCEILFEKFPEMKTITEGEKVVISKQTQAMAFKTVSTIIANVQSGQGVDAKSVQEVIGHMVDEVISSANSIMNLIDIKSFDDYTFTHNINVATLSILLGHELGLNKEDLLELGIGAMMHDIGKLKVPLAILNKDGKLTNEEFTEMKKHPQYGFDILSENKDISMRSRAVALQHHEKFQGRGYPNGLKGAAISFFARICAVADVYDALTTDRPYRIAMTPYDAVKIVMSGIDNHFDPGVLQGFIRRFSIYPTGSLVCLSDGSIALVLRTNPESVLRPIVKLLKDRNGKVVKERIEIDLMKEKQLFIKRPADRASLNVKGSI